MLVKEIYRNLDALINRDGTDDYWGIDDFNRLIGDEQTAFISEVIEEEQDNPQDRRPMRDYLRKAQLYSAASPVPTYTLPSDYMRHDSLIYLPALGSAKPVEVIDPLGFIMRVDNMMAPPMEENYVAYIEETDELRCFPEFTTGSWGLFYIPIPDDPFLDYYMDATNNLLFLSAGQYYSLGAGQYRDGTVGAVGTSITVELGFPEEYHLRFLGRLIDRMGLKDKDTVTMQYANNKEQNSSSKN